MAAQGELTRLTQLKLSTACVTWGRMFKSIPDGDDKVPDLSLCFFVLSLFT